jgi:hypothetical protein
MQSNLSQRAATFVHTSPYLHYKGLVETTMPTIFRMEMIGGVLVREIFEG